jgi:pumilio homology domain family member 6
VKEHAVSLSKHKTGYRLLLAIFDSVDDTVLVKKVIVSTLVANLKDIVKDHWGIMVSLLTADSVMNNTNI